MSDQRLLKLLGHRTAPQLSLDGEAIGWVMALTEETNMRKRRIFGTPTPFLEDLEYQLTSGHNDQLVISTTSLSLTLFKGSTQLFDYMTS